ncbi:MULTISPECIES: AlpA family transcriptional regulator [Acetobacteraceae]|uniref:helix-turn-helix transcriptional regulator n=1 Tax=Acetobacteraceae TaxID=433 RepID=UPI001B8B4C7F|nr:MULTISPECIES: AlpA family phage regulatory protein [Acetobacteraceae]MBS1084527.1 AlpA family phage regulatory protein [Gluconobacter kondonii]MBV1836213.1 AlpA family phage regulatory protein [Acetobacter estunensis]
MADEFNDQRLLTIDDLLLLTGYRSRATIYRHLHKNICPKPIIIGGGRVRWRSGDIEHWLKSLPTQSYR